jgi:sigma-E factor negative regulatory protein RseA
MQDKISALMDSELDPEDAAAVFKQFAKTDGLSEQWAVYHLISDALGQSEVRPRDISRRVSARLAAEPPIPTLHSIPAVPVLRPVMKRKPVAYAAAASIAAVAVAGWMSLQTTQGPTTLQQNLADSRTAPAATIPAIPVTMPAPGPASAPTQINDYLLAHREFSPGIAMHGVVPYMRTAVESRDNFAR